MSSELNELSWWSRWAEVKWLRENAFVMRSKAFHEYFFNRAGFTDCEADGEIVARMEGELGRSGGGPHITVMNGCRGAAELLGSRGYTMVDEMILMGCDGPAFGLREGLTISSGPRVSTEDWASTYLTSFYGDASMSKPMNRIAERLASDASTTLFAASMDDRVLGVLGAHRTRGLLGIYCVGTLPEFRKGGVAGSLINQASTLGLEEGRKVVLQTISSDGLEGFYTKGGFRRFGARGIYRGGASRLRK